MSIKLITNISKSSSFRYVSLSTKNLLSEYDIDIVSVNDISNYVSNSILIHSTLYCLSKNISADIWWTDEPMLIPNRLAKFFECNNKFKYFIAISEYYKDHVEKYFRFKVDDVVFRPYNPIADDIYMYYKNKEYDIINIAVDDYSKRKNVDLVMDYCLSNSRVKTVFITNKFIPKRSNITVIKTGTINEYDKYVLISKSRFLLFPSSCESFGLPVLEAMAVGTIPIYPDTPPFNEFAEGIKIKNCMKIYTYRYGCKTIMYQIDKNDLFDTISYALSLNADEYNDLSNKCREKAININREIKNKLIRWIDKIKY